MENEIEALKGKLLLTHMKDIFGNDANSTILVNREIEGKNVASVFTTMQKDICFNSMIEILTAIIKQDIENNSSPDLD